MRYGAHITLALFLSIFYFKVFKIPFEITSFLIFGMLIPSFDYVFKKCFGLYKVRKFHNFFSGYIHSQKGNLLLVLHCSFSFLS